MYEQQNEQRGGIRNVEMPKYKQNDKLKAYVEYDKKSNALFYPVGFYPPAEIEAIAQEYARDFGEQEEQEVEDAAQKAEKNFPGDKADPRSLNKVTLALTAKETFAPVNSGTALPQTTPP